MGGDETYGICSKQSSSKLMESKLLLLNSELHFQEPKPKVAAASEVK